MNPAQIFPIQRSIFSADGEGSGIDQFREPALCYQPPYAGPAHDQLAWYLVRHLHPASDMAYRVPVETTTGTFMVDFIVSRGSHRVGFVICDANDTAAVREDSAWHALLLATGAVDTIYCVRGARIEERIIDVLSAIAGWQPDLFSPDGLAALSARANHVSNALVARGTGSEIHLVYGEPIDDMYLDEPFTWPAPELDELVVSRMMAAPHTRSARSESRRSIVARVA